MSSLVGQIVVLSIWCVVKQCQQQVGVSTSESEPAPQWPV